MKLDMNVHIWKEDRQYLAHAMPLDVMSSGPTPEAARRAVDEAVHLFLQTALEVGTLEEILEECGYERQGDRWVSPSLVSVEKHDLAIAV